MTHIFVSYARDDIEAEDGILKHLIVKLRHNFTIWLDKTDITAGTNWKEALNDAVKTSQAVVFLMSPRSVASMYCEAELDAAVNTGIPIVPYVYEEAEFPFGLGATNAIFHNKDNHPQQKLEEALREHAPDAYIHGTSQFITQGHLHDRNKIFSEVAENIHQALHFVATLKDGMGKVIKEVALIGLPLSSTQYCTGYLLGRAEDTLGWQSRIQLCLQFSGEYRSSRFPVQVAQHFLQDNNDFPLRLLLIYGPPQIVYNQRHEAFSLMHVLEPPNEHDNQWADAVASVSKTLRIYSDNRGELELQIFAQGPVAGILYELGAKHRGLHYSSEHYHYDRDSRHYHRVLGKLD